MAQSLLSQRDSQSTILLTDDEGARNNKFDINKVGMSKSMAPRDDNYSNDGYINPDFNNTKMNMVIQKSSISQVKGKTQNQPDLTYEVGLSVSQTINKKNHLAANYTYQKNNDVVNYNAHNKGNISKKLQIAEDQYSLKSKEDTDKMENSVTDSKLTVGQNSIYHSMVSGTQRDSRIASQLSGADRFEDFSEMNDEEDQDPFAEFGDLDIGIIGNNESNITNYNKNSLEIIAEQSNESGALQKLQSADKFQENQQVQGFQYEADEDIITNSSGGEDNHEEHSYEDSF